MGHEARDSYAHSPDLLLIQRGQAAPICPQATDNPTASGLFAERLKALREKDNFGAVLFSSHVRKVRCGTGEVAAPVQAQGSFLKWSDPTFSVPEKSGPGRGSPGAGQVTPKAAVPQVNRFSKSRDRALLLTDRHLYKLDPGRQYRVMRAVPLEAVSPGGGGKVGASAGPLHSRLPGKVRAF